MPSLTRPKWYYPPIRLPADAETVYARRSWQYYQPFAATYDAAGGTFTSVDTGLVLPWTGILKWMHSRVLRVMVNAGNAVWITDTAMTIVGIPTGLKINGVDAIAAVSITANVLVLQYAVPVVAGDTWSVTVSAGTTPSVEQAATGLVQ